MPGIPTQPELAKSVFGVMNMMSDGSMKLAGNYTAVVPKVDEGRIAAVALTGSHNYTLTFRVNSDGGVALASQVFDTPKRLVEQSMIDDAMCELAKMVAGEIRNLMAADHKIAEPALLSSDQPLAGVRVIAGVRLELGNEEAVVDVVLLDCQPTPAVETDTAIRPNARSILVAQSDEAAVGAVKAAAESLGMHVASEVLDGVRALDDIRRLRPDVVCLDFNLAQLNGLEVLATVRGEMPDTIIFLISAGATADNVRSALKLRPNGIVVRPFEKARLIGEISRALEQRQKSKAAS